jgi:hypothetical protein
MTDWHDIVDMINTFSQVFHLRQSPTDAATTYPPVPTVINPPAVKKISASATNTASSRSGQVEGAEQNAEGYTGELGASRDSSQNDETSPGEVSAPLQWRDIWPEV